MNWKGAIVSGFLRVMVVRELWLLMVMELLVSWWGSGSLPSSRRMGNWAREARGWAGDWRVVVQVRPSLERVYFSRRCRPSTCGPLRA